MKDAKGRLVDPVQDQDDEGKALEEELVSNSQKGLDDFDFKPLPVQAAKQVHPFDGYPFPKKIKIGTYKEKGVEKDLMVCPTFLVALAPNEYVHQDISNKGVSQVSNGVERVVDFETFHNRSVVNSRGQNTDIVFDRTVTLPSGKKITRVAIIDDHLCRAQVMFSVNRRSGKVEVDTRYIILDQDQAGRLRKTFEMFNYQQTKSERLSKQFYDEPESRGE